MELAKISEDTLESFALIIKEDAFERLKNGARDTFAFGAVEDGMPVGAVVVRCIPPTGEIISLFVVEEYRRQRIGSKLCFEALTLLMNQRGFSMLAAPFTEADGEDVFNGFYKSLLFDIQEVGTDYIVRTEDVFGAMESKSSGTPKMNAKYYNELDLAQKRLLFRDMDLPTYVRSGNIREDLGIVVFDDNFSSILGCMLFAEADGELAVIWLQSNGSGLFLYKLIFFALERIKKEEGSIDILHCPCINDRSQKLFHSALGDKISYDKKVSYEALFSFAGL